MTPWPLPAAFPPTLAGCVLAILAFDAIAAALARRFPSVKYGSLWPLQFGCYVAFGFVAMFELLDVRFAAAIGAITGLIEATLGWAITWRIGPGRQPNTNAATIAIAVGSMVAFGFGLALLGAFVLNAAILVELRLHR